MIPGTLRAFESPSPPSAVMFPPPPEAADSGDTMSPSPDILISLPPSNTENHINCMLFQLRGKNEEGQQIYDLHCTCFRWINSIWYCKYQWYLLHFSCTKFLLIQREEFKIFIFYVGTSCVVLSCFGAFNSNQNFPRITLIQIMVTQRNGVAAFLQRWTKNKNCTCMVG